MSRTIYRNVARKKQKILDTHEKKLHNLTNTANLPFKSEEIITNLSSYTLSSEEEELLTTGLNQGIAPLKIRKTDIFYSFELLSRFFNTNLNDKKDDPHVRSTLSHVANSYYNSYKPSKSTLKKHGLLKKLRNNKDIVLMKPDKGNAVVI